MMHHEAINFLQSRSNNQHQRFRLALYDKVRMAICGGIIVSLTQGFVLCRALVAECHGNPSFLEDVETELVTQVTL